jgi:LemA protein
VLAELLFCKLESVTLGAAPSALARLPGLLFHWTHFLQTRLKRRGQIKMGSNVITGAAFLLFVVGVIIYIVILYNELVRLRNDNDRSWANIDVLLKQRHDEIPNLVETVKGYMQHEQQTLLAVTQARAASMNAASIGQKATADLMMTGALRGLFAVAENYPQLKANENFLKLQTRISELEERIADRREFFNDDVNTYNTRIGQIPEVFVASFMSLKPRAMFQVSDEDRKLVEVKFQSQGQGAAGA